VQETETRGRPAGECRLQGLGGVITMEKAGVPEKMDMNEHEENEQTEARADPRSQLFGHLMH